MKKQNRSLLVLVALVVLAAPAVALGIGVVKRVQGTYVYDGLISTFWQSGTVRLPTSMSAVVGTKSGNNIDVQLTFKDGDGSAVAFPYETYCWVSDSSVGAAFASTANTAALSAVTNGTVESVTSGKSANTITGTTGLLGLRNTQSSSTSPTVYDCCRLALGATACSGAIAFH